MLHVSMIPRCSHYVAGIVNLVGSCARIARDENISLKLRKFLFLEFCRDMTEVSFNFQKILKDMKFRVKFQENSLDSGSP